MDLLIYLYILYIYYNIILNMNKIPKLSQDINTHIIWLDSFCWIIDLEEWFPRLPAWEMSIFNKIFSIEKEGKISLSASVKLTLENRDFITSTTILMDNIWQLLWYCLCIKKIKWLARAISANNVNIFDITKLIDEIFFKVDLTREKKWLVIGNWRIEDKNWIILMEVWKLRVSKTEVSDVEKSRQKDINLVSFKKINDTELPSLKLNIAKKELLKTIFPKDTFIEKKNNQDWKITLKATTQNSKDSWFYGCHFIWNKEKNIKADPVMPWAFASIYWIEQIIKRFFPELLLSKIWNIQFIEQIFPETKEISYKIIIEEESNDEITISAIIYKPWLNEAIYKMKNFIFKKNIKNISSIIMDTTQEIENKI